MTLFNRLEDPEERQGWSFVPLSIPQSTLPSAMLQQLPNKYVVHKEMVPGALCVCVIGFLHSKFSLKFSSLRKPFLVNPSSL